MTEYFIFQILREKYRPIRIVTFTTMISIEFIDKKLCCQNAKFWRMRGKYWEKRALLGTLGFAPATGVEP